MGIVRLRRLLLQIVVFIISLVSGFLVRGNYYLPVFVEISYGYPIALVFIGIIITWTMASFSAFKQAAWTSFLLIE